MATNARIVLFAEVGVWKEKGFGPRMHELYGLTGGVFRGENLLATDAQIVLFAGWVLSMEKTCPCLRG